jgi:peptidoglycan/xylan/chitin deacetylase (PgdA/CDA1 family)
MSHTVGMTVPSSIEPPIKERQPSARRLYMLYHELRAGKTRYSYVTDTLLFEQHLDLYVQLRHSQNPTLVPEITFDDGHVSNHELAAPLLQSRGLSAIFFITVGWTGQKAGYMGWDELRSLHQAGHTIGAHGWTHTLLTHCSHRELGKELIESRATLEDKLGVAVTTMSLPGGRSNRRVLKACEDAGYRHVYTSMPQPESLPLSATVGRLNVRGDMQVDWIARLFAPDGKLLTDLGRQSRRKELLKKLLGDTLYFKLWALANGEEKEPSANEEAVG